MPKKDHKQLIYAVIDEWRPFTYYQAIAIKSQNEVHTTGLAMRNDPTTTGSSSSSSASSEITHSNISRRTFMSFFSTCNFTALQDGLKKSGALVRSLCPGLYKSTLQTMLSKNDMDFLKKTETGRSKIPENTRNNIRRRINLKDKLASMHVEMLVHIHTWGQTPTPFPLYLGICAKLGGLLSNRYITFFSTRRLRPSLRNIVQGLKHLATSKVQDMKATLNTWIHEGRSLASTFNNFNRISFNSTKTKVSKKV